MTQSLGKSAIQTWCVEYHSENIAEKFVGMTRHRGRKNRSGTLSEYIKRKWRT